MTPAPLDHFHDLLSAATRKVAARETPIPTLAARAAVAAGVHPGLVRGDIGQIVGVDPKTEVLYGPPVGLEPLRAALAETWNLTFGLAGGALPGLPDGLVAANVLVCTGAAEGLSLLFKCFAEDKVVGLPHGHWENYTNGVDMAGGRGVTIDFFDARGELDAEGIARRIREDDVRVLVANFPCNPTGAALDAGECEKLAQVARDTGVLLVADEVYSRLRYDGLPPETLLRHAPGHAVVVSSASKEYLLPGARTGFVVCANAALTDGVLRKVLRAHTASSSVLGQTRLLALVEAGLVDLRQGREPSLLTQIKDEMRRRRGLLLDVLNKHGFSTVGRAGHPPVGTIFLMAGLPSWWKGTDTELVEATLAAGVMSAIPGAAFGLPGAVRLSYGAMNAEAIARLDANLEVFRASLAARAAPGEAEAARA